MFGQVFIVVVGPLHKAFNSKMFGQVFITKTDKSIVPLKVKTTSNFQTRVDPRWSSGLSHQLHRSWMRKVVGSNPGGD